ncbi:MAG: nucleotide exchange factor GrpE [Legionellales bacterium]|nr:nucleotide exchange factor GrpE [Legionellales bacterium]|tara:strand:+ start:244 stop:849 length:606 start_codon:yes stop_codon:yes gene_type:complete
MSEKKTNEPKTPKQDQEPMASADFTPSGSSDFKEEVSEAVNNPEADALKHELEASQEQLNKAMEALKQAQQSELMVRADVDNYRKRMDQEIKRTKTFIAQQFIESMLPVVDSLEAALEAAKGIDAVESGLEMTVKLFQDALKKYDVVAVETDGKTFDPKQHEAMTTIEKEGATSGSIIQVIQKGYFLKDRLLRPARVIIAK